MEITSLIYCYVKLKVLASLTLVLQEDFEGTPGSKLYE